MSVFDNQIVLLAGLPRTGSTLLTNILVQNPNFHVEGNSGLCQIMWDAKVSCEVSALEQLVASGRKDKIQSDVIGNIVSSYYNEVKGKTIIDKCRPWVSQPNIEMARSYISHDVKAIVMLRPVDEIVASYARVHFAKGGNEGIYDWLLADDNHVLMNSYHSVMYAIESGAKNHFFLTYDELTSQTQKFTRRLYDFIGQDYFVHNIRKIEQVITENDEDNNMVGMHTIRPKLCQVKNKVQLPSRIKEKCDILTDALFGTLSSFREAI
jgi:sulfotransferase